MTFTAMSDELTVSVVDTNVLVYAHLNDAPHHAASFQLLDLARTGQQAFAVTPQILMEFHAVITDSRRVSKPFQPEEVREAVERMLDYPTMTVLPVPLDVAEQTLRLADKHKITGPAIFDAQIAATMIDNGVNGIFTFDKSGFKPFSQIEVLQPA